MAFLEHQKYGHIILLEQQEEDGLGKAKQYAHQVIIKKLLYRVYEWFQNIRVRSLPAFRDNENFSYQCQEASKISPKHTNHCDQDSRKVHTVHQPSTNGDERYQSPSKYLVLEELIHTIHPKNVLQEEQ